MTQGYPCGWAGVSSSSCRIQRYGVFHYICHSLVLYIWKPDAQTLRSYNITCFLLDIPVYWQCLKPWYSHCYDDCLNHSKHKEGGGLCRCRIFPPAIKFLSGFFWRLSRFPGTVGLGGGMLDSTKGRGYRSVYLLKFSTSSSSPHFSQSSSFWAIASLIEPNLSIMLYT